MALGLLKLFTSFKSKEKEKKEQEEKEKNNQNFWLASSLKEEELKKTEKDKLNIKKGK